MTGESWFAVGDWRLGWIGPSSCRRVGLLGCSRSRNRKDVGKEEVIGSVMLAFGNENSLWCFDNVLFGSLIVCRSLPILFIFFHVFGMDLTTRWRKVQRMTSQLSVLGEESNGTMEIDMLSDFDWNPSFHELYIYIYINTHIYIYTDIYIYILQWHITTNSFDRCESSIMAGLLLTSRSGRVAEGVLHFLFVLRVVGQERLMFKL